MSLINAADKSPRLMILVPLTTLAYAAMLGFFYSYAWMATHYSELLELKINHLLGSPEYLFENYYVGPKPHRSEILPFFILWLLTISMPLAFTSYGFLRMFRDDKIPQALSWGTLIFLIVGFAFIVWSLVKIVVIRKRMNVSLFAEWQASHKSAMGGNEVAS